MRTEFFCFAVTWCPSTTSTNLSVSSNDPGMKSVTSGVIWHVNPESKIQLVNYKLSPWSLFLRLSSLDIRAIDAYTLRSLSPSLLSHARLHFSLDFSDLRLFSLSLSGLGHFAIRWSSDPHQKHFRAVRSEFLLEEVPAERAFYFSFLIFLKHFSTEWLESPQYLHFVWTEFAFSLCLLDPELLLSRFKYSVC